MSDRADELRSFAAQCLALAQSTIDPTARAELVTMAQRLYDLANRPPADFNAIAQVFNDQQMSPDKPAMQQQQCQPKQDGDDE